MNPSDPYRGAQVRRGIRHYLSGRAIQAAASVVVMLIMVRVLSVEQYALYVTATALATLLGTLSLLGLDRVVARYVPEGRLTATPGRLIRFIRQLNLLRLAGIGVLALVLAPTWGHWAAWFNLPPAGLTLPVLLYALIHAFMLFQGIVMQSLMLQAGLRDATTATWLLRILLLLGVLLLVPPLDVIKALWLTLISELVGWLWMAVAIARHLRQLRRAAADQADAAWPRAPGELVRFAWHNFLLGHTNYPSQPRVQQLVAAYFLPPALVAAYGFFRNIAEQLRAYLPVHLMKNLAEPVMIGHYVRTGDFARLNAMSTVLLKLNLLLIAPLSAWLWLAGGPLIALVTGGKFAEHAGLLALLVLALAVRSLASLLQTIANAIGLSRQLPAASLAASLATLVLLWVHIPWAGAVALVLTDLVFNLVSSALVLRGMHRAGYRYGFGGGWKLLRMLALAPLVALPVAALSVSPDAGWLPALLAGVAIIVLYLAANVLWKPLSPEERELLQSVSGRIRVPI